MISIRPESDAAIRVIQRCSAKQDIGYVCAGSLKDIYYIACKNLGEQAARDFVRAFLMIFEVCPLDGSLCKIAANSSEPDFEDALICASAEDIHADFILTRDTSAFRHTTIRSLSAHDYISLFS